MTTVAEIDGERFFWKIEERFCRALLLSRFFSCSFSPSTLPQSVICTAGQALFREHIAPDPHD